MMERTWHAVAEVKGSPKYPEIEGKVRFCQTECGVLTAAEVFGLPDNAYCGEGVFGFHIHEGACCSGTGENPFADALGHFNPTKSMHPYHAGDMPPLFGNNGYALLIFLSDRFTVEEIIGRTVIIHAMVDDFTSQPSGNAGEMIACGEIQRI